MLSPRAAQRGRRRERTSMASVRFRPRRNAKNIVGCFRAPYGRERVSGPWSPDMPRYFFHIRDPVGLIKDTEGLELPSVRRAIEEAEASARSIAEQRRAMPGRCSIEVWDDVGFFFVFVFVFLLLFVFVVCF